MIKEEILEYKYFVWGNIFKIIYVLRNSNYSIIKKETTFARKNSFAFPPFIIHCKCAFIYENK